MCETDDAFGDGADEQAGDAGAAVGGDDDQLGVFFLGVVGDAVGRLAEEYGGVDTLELGGGELFAEQLLDLLDAGLRIDDTPDFPGFEWSDVDQDVNDMQVLGRIDKLATHLDGC